MSASPTEAHDDQVPRPGSLRAGGWRAPGWPDLVALREQARRNVAARDRHGVIDLALDPDAPEPGADLLGALERQDTRGLDDGGWLDRLDAIERVTSRLAALRAHAVAGFDDATRGTSADLGHDLPTPGDRPARAGERRWHGGLLRSVTDELGLVLNTGRAATGTRVVRCWELVHNYPATLAALGAGELTEHAAFTLVDELRTLVDQTQVAAAEATLLDWARTHPLHRFTRRARHEVATRDATATTRIHRRRLDQRAIRMHANDAGTADLVSTHDAVHAAAVMTSLTHAAQTARRHGDPRTLDQLRADIALTRMLGHPRTGDQARDRGGPAPEQPTEPAIATEVVIHATAAELQAIVGGLPGTGGQITGYGTLPQTTLIAALAQVAAGHTPRATTPITGTAAVAAALRTTATAPGTSPTTLRWHRRDRPPGSNPDRYVPSARLAQWIRDRDRHCRFPGCGQHARYCDLDHRTPFDPNDPHGGRTTADNLHALCRHHHRLKHRGGWKVRHNPDGTTTWTSPTGRTYQSDPDDP